MVLNHRLRELNLSQEDSKLLEEVAQGVQIKPRDLAREILHKELMRMKDKGLQNFRVALIELSDKKISPKSNLKDPETSKKTR